MCVGVAGLRQILTDVIEEVRESISLDVDGGDVVHSLLNASWLQSLLKVVHFWAFFSSPGFWGLEPSRLSFCLSFLLSNKRVDLVWVGDQTAVGPSKGATMCFPGV